MHKITQLNNEIRHLTSSLEHVRNNIFDMLYQIIKIINVIMIIGIL